MIFSYDDIHRVRVEMADKYRNMPPEEADRDLPSGNSAFMK
jgi:hypothetical protein